MRIVKVKANDGSLLVEVLLYMTICSLIIGMVLLLNTQERKEYYAFDREGRLLFAHMKRMQMATLYGKLQVDGGGNRIVLERNSYGYIDSHNALAYRQLPKSMHIEYTGGHPIIWFHKVKGVGRIYTLTLVDDVIRYKRTFIFARQSGRIRWEESKI